MTGSYIMDEEPLSGCHANVAVIDWSIAGIAMDNQSPLWMGCRMWSSMRLMPCRTRHQRGPAMYAPPAALVPALDCREISSRLPHISSHTACWKFSSLRLSIPPCWPLHRPGDAGNVDDGVGS